LYKRWQFFVARLFRGGDLLDRRGEILRRVLGRESMKNLNFLVAAYIAIWAIFCVYLISVARRMASLQDDIRRLKEGGK
jgi:CcmD family protein